MDKGLILIGCVAIIVGIVGMLCGRPLFLLVSFFGFWPLGMGFIYTNPDELDESWDDDFEDSGWVKVGEDDE